MGTNSKTTYGADGSSNLLSFYPEKLTIVTDPSHPLYDERHALPFDEATVRNMMAYGVLEPIIVTRDPDTGAVLVVDGRQRVKNAAEANRRLDAEGRPMILVPATTRKGDSAATMMGVMVATNQLRQADPPLVIANKMQRMKALGQDDDAVALAFGCNRKTVEGYLSLLDCAKPVQKAIEGGYLGVTDAKYMARLTPAQQTAKVEEIIRSTAGKEGHARARAKREVLRPEKAAAEKLPKLKTRKEIEERIGDLEAQAQHHNRAIIAELLWVLGGQTTEPTKDTRTRDMVDELDEASK